MAEGRDPALDKLRSDLIVSIADVTPDSTLRKAFSSANEAKMALREANAVINDHYRGYHITARVEGLDLVVEESFGH